MFHTYKVPTIVLKIGIEIGEKFSRCLLFTQKLLYKNACSTFLVFFFNTTEIFELISLGFVVVDNFHSQFLVLCNDFCFSVSFSSRETALSQSQGFLCQNQSD